MCDMTHCMQVPLWWTEEIHSSIYLTWLIDMCDMTRWHVWHDSLIRVTWLVDLLTCVCDMTHSCRCLLWWMEEGQGRPTDAYCRWDSTHNTHYTCTHHTLQIHTPRTTHTPTTPYTVTHHTLHRHPPHTTDTHHTLHRHPPHTTHTPTTTSKERESSATHVTHFNESRRYGVATISRLLKIIGLFHRISSLL